MEEEAERRPSLFSLIEAGDWEQLDQSLQEDEGLTEELASFSQEGRRPLELAAMLGKSDVARVLVNRAGAEVNTSNKSGTSLSSLSIPQYLLDYDTAMIALFICRLHCAAPVRCLGLPGVC
jgi:hypothetical protein